MSDEDGRNSQGIPSWQRAASASAIPPSPEPEPSPNAPDAATSPDQDSSIASPTNNYPLTQKALKFLEDEGVRDAPLAKKMAFLEGKGLSKTDIQTALGLTKSEPVSSTLPTTEVNTTNLPTVSPDFAQLFKNDQPPSPIPRRDIPPIITYPEFLVQPQKPPPIITAQRLVTTAYVASALGAAVYGASKFLITPMIEALTGARHEFAQNAQNRLDELIQKLGHIVSVDPQNSFSSTQMSKDIDVVSEADTTDSDPTELFHRDYGTQTSPSLIASPVQTPSEALSFDSNPTTNSNKVVDAELSVLHSMKSKCVSLNDAVSAESTGMDEITSSITALNDYLDTLMTPSYNSNPVYGGAYGTTNSKTDSGKKEEDEILRLRTEIRGIKGVLLSARNFPSGGRKTMFPNPANTGG